MDVFGLGWLVGARVMRETDAPLGQTTMGLEGFAAAPGSAVAPATTASPTIRDNLWLILVAGLVSIIVAAIVITAYYRHFSTTTLISHSTDSSRNTAQAALDSLQDGITAHLQAREDGLQVEFPRAAAHALRDLIFGTTVRQIRVLDRHGRVVFTTGANGTSGDYGPQIAAALAGQVVSQASYRDSFSFDERADTPSNEVRLWLPIAHGGNRQTLGVFETTTDISALALIQERNELLLGIGALVILLTLYIAFLLGLRALEQRHTTQQRLMRERERRLPEMFRRSVQAEELAKRKLAEELHEQVAQTLAAVKLSIERAATTPSAAAETSRLLSGVVSPLTETICEVREVASSLHPNTLADFGLGVAVEKLFSGVRTRRPATDWTLYRELDDRAVPEAMRPVIYRLVEHALEAAVATPRLSRFRLLLGIEDDCLILRIRDDASQLDVEEEANPYSVLREKTLLSGGEFVCRSNSWGGIVIRIAWPLATTG